MIVSISIALAIIVLTWSAFAVHAINTRPMRTIIKSTSKEVWAYAIIAGVFIGAIFYTVQNTAAPTPLAIVYYILMASSFGALGYACYSAPSVKLLEILPLGLLALVCWYVMSSISETISIGGHLLTFIHLLPHVLCIATIGFFIAHAFHFRYKEMHKGKSWRNSCVITAIATIAFMVAVPIMSIGSNPFEGIDAKLPNDPVAEAETTDAATGGEDDFSYIPTEKNNNQQDSNYAIKVKSVDDLVITEKEKKVIPDDLLPVMEEIIADGKVTKAEKVKVREQTILNNAKHDPTWLADKAHFIGGVWDDPNNWKPLFDKSKKRLSKEGEKLYYKFEGAMEASTLERENAPANGTNSGYSNGQNVVAETSGISGNLEAIKITTKSGEIVGWIMDRCGNDVYPPGTIPPKIIPPGKTDDPDPPTKKTTTPTTTPKKGKDPAKDPVNNGNASKGGGQDKPSDGSGNYQKSDPRTEKPTGNSNHNGQGHADPKTVTPKTPPASNGSNNTVTYENKMNYQPDPVTNRGPADSSKPATKTEGDGEFTPED